MSLLLKQLGDMNPTMRSVANDIICANAKFWDPPQAPWFTDHGPRHSERILNIVEQIVFGVRNFLASEPLRPEEILALVGAIYLHDIGMQVTRGLDQRISYADSLSGNVAVGLGYEAIVRPEHPYTIHRMIHHPDYGGVPLRRLGLHRCPREIQIAIAEISLSHGKFGYLRELYSAPRGRIRLDLLGSLLQVGDVLEICYERVNMQLFDWINLSFVSQAHWLVSTLVSSVVIDSSGSILVTYHVPEEIYHDAILAYNVREAVEQNYIRWNGSEVFPHLKKYYHLNLKLPYLDNRDYSHANFPMIVCGPSLYPLHYYHVMLATFQGKTDINISKDRQRIGEILWPESPLLVKVIEAFATDVGLPKVAGELPVHSDVGIAYQCGIPYLLAKEACSLLKNCTFDKKPILHLEDGPSGIAGISYYRLNKIWYDKLPRRGVL